MPAESPTHDGGCHRIRLAGEIDLARRPELDDIVSAFARSGRPDAVVEIDDVDYCGSTGLALVVRLAHIATSRGGTVRVTGARPQVRRVFDITGLGRFLGD